MHDGRANLNTGPKSAETRARISRSVREWWRSPEGLAYRTRVRDDRAARQREAARAHAVALGYRLEDIERRERELEEARRPGP